MVTIGAVLFAISLIGGIVAVVQVVAKIGSPLSQALRNPAYETPADFRMTLETGKYTVYASSSGNSAGNDQVTVSASDVTVTGPDGKDIAVVSPGDDLESIGRGTSDYRGAARFDAPGAGSYRIEVAKQPNATVVVAPSIAPSFTEIGYWVLAAFGFGLTGLIGFILLIVGLVRRSSAKKQAAFAGYPGQGYPGQGYPGQSQPGQGQPGQGQPGQAQPYGQQGYPYGRPSEQPAQPPPAGWYPDPAGSGKSRYWDGGAWTEHQR